MTHDIRAPLARSRNARRAALIIRDCHHAALSRAAEGVVSEPTPSPCIRGTKWYPYLFMPAT